MYDITSKKNNNTSNDHHNMELNRQIFKDRGMCVEREKYTHTERERIHIDIFGNVVRTFSRH